MSQSAQATLTGAVVLVVAVVLPLVGLPVAVVGALAARRRGDRTLAVVLAGAAVLALVLVVAGLGAQRLIDPQPD